MGNHIRTHSGGIRIGGIRIGGRRTRACLLTIVLLLITLFAHHSTNAHANEHDIGNWSEIAKLTASDGTQGDWLGFSVAISDKIAVVGAPNDDQNGIDSGAVYLYQKGIGWSDRTEAAELTATGGNSYDHFGSSVAIAGDTVIVGAPNNDINGSDSGVVYVFERPDDGWISMTETAKLTPSDPDIGDLFGTSVGISDGTIVVGAPHLGALDEGDSGVVYIFRKPAEGWSDQNEAARITPTDGESWDGFGFSTAISGDTIVAGAPFDDHNDRNSGSAYIFSKTENGWTDLSEVAKLTAANGAAHDWLGRSISISADSIIAGAPQTGINGYHSGSAYLYTRPLEGWQDMTETALLTPSDGEKGSNFGWSVVIDEDLAAASALTGETSHESVGVYIYERPGDGWTTITETLKLSPSREASLERFGISLDGSARTFLVGADSDDDNGSDSGAAYLFAQTGTIVISKETKPAGGTAFNFDQDIRGLESTFTLDDGQTETFSNIPCGTYAVVELDPAPAYDLTALECTDSVTGGDDSIGSTDTRTATIHLDPGEIVNCQFVNEARGRILVKKVTEPASHTQSFSFSLTGEPDNTQRAFMLSAQDEAYDSGYLKPGLYHLAENTPSNWTLDSAVCSDSSQPAFLELNPGESIRCTFTNKLHKFDILIPLAINAP